MNIDTIATYLIAVLIGMIVAALGSYYIFVQFIAPNQETPQVVVSQSETPLATTTDQVVPVVISQGSTTASSSTTDIMTFTGTLEEVNIGCFSDGECYVVVDGKHVTAIMGWSREIVGSVEGVEGFGDLESHIGKQVAVRAKLLEDGTYTLYGDTSLYIRALQ
jgi:hypothetical protein